MLGEVVCGGRRHDQGLVHMKVALEVWSSDLDQIVAQAIGGDLLFANDDLK